MTSGDDSIETVAEQLRADVKRLNDGAEHYFTGLAKVAKWNRRLLISAVVGLVVALGLCVAVIVGLFAVNRNTDDIRGITTRLNATVTVQRQQALCPLYQVFLGFQDMPIQPDQSPQQKAYVAHAFDVIRSGYNVLECQNFLSK